MTFSKIVEMCERHGFLKKIVMYNQDILRVGPIGAILQENLRNEWIYSVLTNRDLTASLSLSSSFTDSFTYIKELCSQKLPFAIAEFEEEQCRNVTQAFIDAKRKAKSDDIDFQQFLVAEDKLILRCTTFVLPSLSTPYFHQWQRHRKAWWRKVSELFIVFK